MKRTLLSLLLAVCASCSTLPEKTMVIKAEHGANSALLYKDLPEHEALKVSFTVHFVGPWDGSGYDQWSPDRFFCKVDSMTMIDSTFNNCHLRFTDNIYRSNRKAVPLKKVTMRLASYLRMINTEKSINLAKQLDAF